MQDAALAALGLVGLIAGVGFVGGMAQQWDAEDAVSQGVATTPLLFGLDAQSIDRAERAGAKPDYGTLWVGAWTERWGWKVADKELDRLETANVTPAVHLYYWGDDIHPDCFSAGCKGKTMQGWDALARDLATHLAEHTPGPAVVILETEFNKHPVKSDEALDGYLAEKATTIKDLNPDVTVVLGLGNWYPIAWPTWDRAAQASDAVGIQAMAGSTHDSDTVTTALFDNTLAGAKTARGLFDKPVFIHDVAVSSYPEPDHLGTQEAALRRLADGLDDLKAAGVEAVLYRSFVDTSTVPVEEHYGEAERHWGLAWTDTGQLKPAGEVWVAAMKDERSG